MSSNLKDAFRDIVKTMKKRLVSTTIHGQTIWVGREIKRGFDAGELVIDP